MGFIIYQSLNTSQNRTEPKRKAENTLRCIILLFIFTLSFAFKCCTFIDEMKWFYVCLGPWTYVPLVNWLAHIEIHIHLDIFIIYHWSMIKSCSRLFTASCMEQSKSEQVQTVQKKQCAFILIMFTVIINWLGWNIDMTFQLIGISWYWITHSHFPIFLCLDCLRYNLTLT